MSNSYEFEMRLDKAFIRAENIFKTFWKGGEEIEVLRDVNLELVAGEILGICGASGAGKSTFLHILGVLDKPTSGNIYFNNLCIGDLSDRELARFRNTHIGFVFQFHHLLSEFSALENTLMPAMIAGINWNESVEKAEELLREVGLKNRIHHRPGELSGGEQQRVAIARALMNDPDLVLADEPTGNLDSKSGERFYNLIERLNEEKKQTFVIVTHNEKIMERFNRTVHLQDGMLVKM